MILHFYIPEADFVAVGSGSFTALVVLLSELLQYAGGMPTPLLLAKDREVKLYKL